MAKPLKKVIHVNRANIAMNARDGGNRPTITTKTYKQNVYGGRVDILDSAGKVVASILDAAFCGRKQLSCGARVWIETRNPVLVNGKPL